MLFGCLLNWIILHGWFFKGAKQGSYKNTEENTPSPLSVPMNDIYSIYHKWCNDDRLDRRLLLCYDHQVNA